MVVKFQVCRRDIEFNFFFFSGIQFNFLKSFQFLNRSRDTSDKIAYIKLDHFLPLHFSGIGNSHRRSKRLIAFGLVGA